MGSGEWGKNRIIVYSPISPISPISPLPTSPLPTPPLLCPILFTSPSFGINISRFTNLLAFP
ncbi:MAG: hypothetical protein DSM106950_03270 [Stigonema ocellatum SAG 48.90 = DSM 106950]|nr:hypothetical protein [Stigonema ocellatum SAG 48.90 = DSM 106950]